MRAVVYKIENQVNGKCYVGVTRQKPERRWGAHKSTARTGKGGSIHRAIRKHKLENFKFEIIFIVLDIKYLNNMEKLFIRELKGLHPTGYNLTSGGVGTRARVCSEATKKKISEANKGNQGCLGREISGETRKRIGDANRGRKRSVEVKRELSKGLLGNQHARGYKHSKETRQKVSDGCTRKRKIVCLETGRIFNSIVGAARYLKEVLGYLKADKSSLTKCCKGKYKQSYGFTWRYIN